MEEKKHFKWDIVEASIIGENHKRNNTPNQDSYKIEHGETWSVIAISDGHGSKKSFRSDIGSKLAVRILGNELSIFMSRINNEVKPSLIKETLEKKLPYILIKKWNTVILSHFKENPFEPGKDYKELSEKEIELIEKNPSIAYGATLIGVVISSQFIAYIQLGDGDIIAVSEDGVVDRPIPKDKRFIANETSSLCTTKAWNEINVRFQTIVENPPALILVCSDGYTNSFVSEDGFLNAGRDFLNITDEFGVEYINENLKEWLEDASEKGSGDDVTVAIVYRQREGVDKYVHEA